MVALVQDCSIFIAGALEIPQMYTELTLCVGFHSFDFCHIDGSVEDWSISIATVKSLI